MEWFKSRFIYYLDLLVFLLLIFYQIWVLNYYSFHPLNVVVLLVLVGQWIKTFILYHRKSKHKHKKIIPIPLPLQHSPSKQRQQQSKSPTLLPVSLSKRATHVKNATSQEESYHFLAFVSHELRSPLHAILNMTEFLLETKSDLTQEQQEYIQTIYKTSQMISRIVSDILDISKYESGQFELELAPFDLYDLLEDVRRMNEPLFLKNKTKNTSGNSDGHVVFSIHLHENLPLKGQLIFGDALRLHQILNNLISNSAKFTSQGSIELHVNGILKTHPSPVTIPMDHSSVHGNGNGNHVTNGHLLNPSEIKQQLHAHWMPMRTESKVSTTPEVKLCLEFKIKDTGIGISEADLPFLFQPYSQVKNKLVQHANGTGLGLCIVKNLVELMHGKIKMESKLNQGTIVTFTVLVNCLQDTEENKYLRNESSFHNKSTRPTSPPRFTSSAGTGAGPGMGTDTTELVPSNTMTTVAIHASTQRNGSTTDSYVVPVLTMTEDQPLTTPTPTTISSLLLTNHSTESSITPVTTTAVTTTTGNPTTPMEGGGDMDTFMESMSSAGFALDSPSIKLKPVESEDGDRNKTTIPIITKSQTILVVDDQLVNIKIATRMLKPYYNVESVQSGLAAIEKIIQIPNIDLILMDLSMGKGELSGQETTIKIRERGFANPIVALTASTTKQIHQSCVEAGMNGVLTKPIHKGSLLKAVQSILQLGRAALTTLLIKDVPPTVIQYVE